MWDRTTLAVLRERAGNLRSGKGKTIGTVIGGTSAIDQFTTVWPSQQLI
jgi:hypothetical protein